MNIERVAIVGAGAWGTALANAIARAGRSVTLIARDEHAAKTIAQTRKNPRLPNIDIDKKIAVTAAIAEVTTSDAVLLAVPAQSQRTAVTALPKLKPTIPVVIGAKGIEQYSRKYMSDIVTEILPQTPVAVLSGPGFASEVGRGLPAAVTLAAQDETLARELALAFGSTTFRLYHSTDVRGVEIGGAAKNVLAIGAGIVEGRGLGHSAAAALTTRGFAELMRFGRAHGARPETMMGLSGLGDVVLSCASAASRNFSFGVNIGQGRSPKDIQQTTGLAEGAFTASVLAEMAQAAKVDMPITAAVAAVVAEKMSVDEAIDALLTRPLRAE